MALQQTLHEHFGHLIETALMMCRDQMAVPTTSERAVLARFAPAAVYRQAADISVEAIVCWVRRYMRRVVHLACGYGDGDVGGLIYFTWREGLPAAHEMEIDGTRFEHYELMLLLLMLCRDQGACADFKTGIDIEQQLSDHYDQILGRVVDVYDDVMTEIDRQREAYFTETDGERDTQLQLIRERLFFEPQPGPGEMLADREMKLSAVMADHAVAVDIIGQEGEAMSCAYEAADEIWQYERQAFARSRHRYLLC